MLVVTAAHSVAVQLDWLIEREQYLVASFRHEAPEKRVAAIRPLDGELFVRFYWRAHSCRRVVMRREERQFAKLLILLSIKRKHH